MATKMKKKVKKEVSPQEYRDFIKGVEIESIFFSRGSFELLVFNRLFWKEEIDFSIKENAKLLERNPKKFVVAHKYNLVISSANKKDEKFLKISADLIVEYSSKKEITGEIFKLFREINLPVNTWPYFREYVHSCMGRLNLPPLILPALKRP